MTHSFFLSQGVVFGVMLKKNNNKKAISVFLRGLGVDDGLAISTRTEIDPVEVDGWEKERERGALVRIPAAVSGAPRIGRALRGTPWRSTFRCACSIDCLLGG